MKRYWSDLHLGHHNIISYCQRPFSDSLVMDAALITAWSDTVTQYPDDELYCLGDVTLWNRASMGRIRASMVANMDDVPKQTLLVMGNHDSMSARTAGLYEHLFERIVGDPKQIYEFAHQTWDEDRLVWLSHAPMPPEMLLGGINIHGHIHNGYDTEAEQLDAKYPWLRGSPQHLNASVERTGYRPMTLDELRAAQAERVLP